MIDDAELVVRLALAVVLAGAIGVERRLDNHPAGVRTHALVGLGAAVFAIAGLQVEGEGSPSRIASGVVAGIGFIGAGLIIERREGGVKGLTTAAGVWTAAGIGVAVGVGAYLVGCVAAALVLALLLLDRLPRIR